MEVTTKQHMEDSGVFFISYKLSASTFKWMAVECCSGLGPFIVE